MYDLAIQQRLPLPVLGTDLPPLVLELFNPSIGFALDVIVNDIVPFLGRRRSVDKHNNAFSIPHYCRKVLDETLQPMHLEGSAHDKKYVRTSTHVEHLQVGNLVTQGVWLVVEHNRRTETSNRSSSSSPRQPMVACCQ